MPPTGSAVAAMPSRPPPAACRSRRHTARPNKRPYKRVKLFGAGKLNRLILGALRRGERAMTTAEVVASIVAELGDGPEAAKGMTNRVRANLRYLRDTRGLVTKEGDRQDARWALNGA